MYQGHQDPYIVIYIGDTMSYSTTLSASTLALIDEFHASHEGLDPVLCHEAAVHDAVHAYLGLGVSLEDEEVVLNCVELLSGRECSIHLAERCEFLLTLLTSDVLVELSVALS